MKIPKCQRRWIAPSHLERDSSLQKLAEAAPDAGEKMSSVRPGQALCKTLEEKLRAATKSLPKSPPQTRDQDPLANASFEEVLDRNTDEQTTRAVFDLIESGLSNPKVSISESKPLGGGVHKTELVKLSNGLTGVWKPDAGACGEKLRENVPKGTEAERDVSAYQVDKHLGHLARVPPTVKREFEGESGVLSFFLDGAEVARDKMSIAGELVFRDQCTATSPIAVLDNVIGNLDRHPTNWLIASTGQAVPIDHGLSFPYRNGTQGFTQYDFHRPVKLDRKTRKKLEHFRESQDEISAKFQGSIGSSATKAMFRRVDRILAEGQTSAAWLGQSDIGEASASRMGYLKNSEYPIRKIPSITEEQAEVLAEANLKNSRSLLKALGDKSSRRHFSRSEVGKKAARIFTPKSFMKALKLSDLMRVRGIGGHFAVQLLAVGVDSVPELAHRNPQNLAERLESLNDQKCRAPGKAKAERWIADAKLMSRKLSF